MTYDQYNQDRTAEDLLAEFAPGSGTGESIGYGEWRPLYDGRVDLIEINLGKTPSRCKISFPSYRWQADTGLKSGDRVRIRTSDPKEADKVCLFSGFVTNLRSGFTGGTESDPARERNAVLCLDHRWLLGVTSIVTNVLARSRVDHSYYGAANQAVIADYKLTVLNGRRVIFNERRIDKLGRSSGPAVGNKDPDELRVKKGTDDLCFIPIFSGQPNAEPWTAGEMVRYLLAYPMNRAYEQLPIEDPADLVGLDSADWDTQLNHVVADGLSVIDAVDLIAQKIGWTFREDYDNEGTASLVFFKHNTTGNFDSQSRDPNPIVSHLLYAPAAAESISDVVATGEKLLWQMDLDEDISRVVNYPIGRGAPEKFETTFELVPAWLDSRLVPVTSPLTDLFFLEADLQEMTAPNEKDYFKYYHVQGSSFRPEVGRKWALNEIGTYSASFGSSYDRGAPFDFSTVIDRAYTEFSDGRERYCPFPRQFLPPLTRDGNSLSSLPIKVEFSFDGGATWQVIPCSIRSLAGEAGIYIEEANLAELVDAANSSISGGTLDGVALNYWTSLCDDSVNARVFKDDAWRTRLRVTASIQLDQRLAVAASPSAKSGSPFHHRRAIDLSGVYKFEKQMPLSSFYGGSQPVIEQDERDELTDAIDSLRDVNEDASLSGRFTLERLWTNDDAGSGMGKPVFLPGDQIEKIVGRDCDLRASIGSTDVYPEIVRVVYMPASQKEQLITRDLRYAVPRL